MRGEGKGEGQRRRSNNCPNPRSPASPVYCRRLPLHDPRRRGGPMKRVVFAALALALAACQSSDLDPGTPLPPPPTAAITAPARNVPAAIAAFSGTWHGKWQNGLDAILAVQTVARDGTATGTYSWGDLPGQFKAGSAAFTGKIASGTLT